MKQNKNNNILYFVGKLHQHKLLTMFFGKGKFRIHKSSNKLLGMLCVRKIYLMPDKQHYTENVPGQARK